MKMVVGLGNPGKRYELSRHNAGFLALDFFAEEMGIVLNKEKNEALLAETIVSREKLLLVKPQTYMNLSGKAVGSLSRYYKILPENILVVHDDLDLEKGRIKIRPNGGSAGHRGVASIIEALGTRDFNRLRIGIGRPPQGIDPVDYVLGVFSEEEIKIFNEKLPRIANAIKMFIEEDNMEKIMSKFNCDA